MLVLKIDFVLLLAIAGVAYGKVATYSTYSKGCSISVRGGLGEPQPLLIWPGTTNFVTPGDATDGIIRLDADTEIELFCTHGFRPYDKNDIIVKCISDDLFSYDENEHYFHEFTCNDVPTHTARSTGEACGDMFSSNTSLIEVGFQVEDRFLHLYTSCHDFTLSSSLWSHYYQNPDNNMFQTGYARVPFSQADFFPGLEVNYLYTIPEQRRTIASILGSKDLSWEFVPSRGSVFLARGHMCAKADFVFGSHQEGTFYFTNTAPQWQSFNGGNWMYIEDGVRRYVANRGIHTKIWTGTYGVMTLPDVNGNQQKIYLKVDENGVGQIPVPKIYYKIVIDPKQAAGIVFIGVNNPHVTQEELNDYIFCDDISNKVSYIRWKKDDFTKGYSYACEVEQFVKRVGHLPKLPEVKQLLL